MPKLQICDNVWEKEYENQEVIIFDFAVMSDERLNKSSPGSTEL